MYWYSWLTTAGIGGIAAAVIALLAPENIRLKIAISWVWIVPAALTLILIFIERTWFGIN